MKTWAQTTRQEHNRQIYEEELEPFLPESILDFHVHLYPPGIGGADHPFSCGGNPLGAYDLADLQRDLSELFPGRKASAVCFGLPDTAYDRAANNARVAEVCDHERFFPFRLYAPTETDQAALHSEIVQQHFLGLKPYLVYVSGKPSSEVEIVDMLPAAIMEVANDLGLIVTLHIPRAERLADPLNISQLRQICTAWPRARIVLAHIGRAYYLKCIQGSLDQLLDLENLYYDLAMLNHWEVLEYLFRRAPHDHILYGSDLPIAIAPGKSVEINDQYTYVTPVPWDLSISDDHHALRFTSFLYEELRAIWKAMDRLGLGADFAQQIFHGNGMKLLASVAY